jgi:hypothetical protein
MIFLKKRDNKKILGRRYWFYKMIEWWKHVEFISTWSHDLVYGFHNILHDAKAYCSKNQG